MTAVPDEVKALVKNSGSRMPAHTWATHNFGTWHWYDEEGNEHELCPPRHHKLHDALGHWRKGLPFLFLYGRPGVGKTHLALAIGWNTIDDGHPRQQTKWAVALGVFPRQTVIFWQVQMMLEDLRMSFEGAHGSFGEKLTALRDCDLLILDDIAGQKQTEWAAAILDALVDHRYMEQLATVFTSNTIEVGAKLPERLFDRCREGTIARVRGESRRGKPYTPSSEVATRGRHGSSRRIRPQEKESGRERR